MPCSSDRALGAHVRIPLRRRLILCVLSLGLATVLFHAQLASGVVSRGDEFLRAGEPARALVFYRRALGLDPASSVAAERYAFVALMRKRHAELEAAVEIASRALARDPSDEALLVDRALCLNALRSYSAAAHDFERLATRTGNPGYYEFAAQAAKRSGERARAAHLFATVVALDARFTAARRELARLRPR
jgi:tetratricopeptide (TPR) repeat protein